MRFLTIFICVFFIQELSAQSFEKYYKQAKEDYYNYVSSNAFDKAIETCPDITKYPELLTYKAADLILNGEYLLAEKYLKLALKYTQKNEDFYLVYNFLGASRISISDFKTGKQYYTKAKQYAKKSKNETDALEAEFSILLCRYEIEGETPTEKEFWNFYNKLPKDYSPLSKIDFINTLLEIYMDKKRFKDAKRIHNYILHNFDLTKFNKEDLSFYYNNVASLELNSKNYKKALQNCDAAYAVFKTRNEEDYLESYKLYRDIYVGSNQLKKALKYSDSIEKLERKLKEQEVKQGIKIVDENLTFKIVQGKIKKQNNLLKVFLLSLLVVTLGAFIFLFFSTKIRKKLYHQVVFYKEKYNSLWSSHQISIKQLENIKEELARQDKNEVTVLAKEISIHLKTNIESEHKHINVLKNEFINSLKIKAPYLNSNELLICFFLSLNLSHKKIAELLDKTEKSVESYKYRINLKIKNYQNTTLEKLLTL